MVSFTSLAAVVATAFAVTAAPTDAALTVGAYYRPTGPIVSGVPGAKTPYRRSPCPAINTLANHGYLPRNGQNVTREALRSAAQTHFNLDDGLADFVTSLVPDVFDLDLLGTHKFIEHDASLVHADSYLGGDPMYADGPLLEDFFGRAANAKPYSVQTMGEIRRDRLASCMKLNPNCSFDGTASFLAFGEATFVIKLFGDGVSNTAPISNVRSFMAYEKFPTNFQKPALLTMDGLTATSALIQAVANAA